MIKKTIFIKRCWCFIGRYRTPLSIKVNFIIKPINWHLPNWSCCCYFSNSSYLKLILTLSYFLSLLNDKNFNMKTENPINFFCKKFLFFFTFLNISKKNDEKKMKNTKNLWKFIRLYHRLWKDLIFKQCDNI